MYDSAMNAARFIVLEGIDGAGTTTQAHRLLQRLRRLDVPVHGTAEPSRGPVGRLLRSLLGGAAAPMDPAAMALLFAADRHDHLAREILPQLAAGVHVICDRYVLSSLAYQTAQGAPRELVRAANAAVRRPDLTILLAVPVEVAVQRREGRPTVDLYENEPMQRAVDAAYRREAEELRQAGEPVVVLDGGLPIGEVEARVWNEVQSCLGL